MNTRIEEYRKCAEICKNTDYGDKASVRAHNRAVTKMYKIVENTEKEGIEAIEILATLLDNPMTKNWLAYQFLEKATLSNDIKNKCLSIIRKMAIEGDSVNAFGARVWLERWDAKEKSK